MGSLGCAYGRGGALGEREVDWRIEGRYSWEAGIRSSRRLTLREGMNLRMGGTGKGIKVRPLGLNGSNTWDGREDMIQGEFEGW